MSKIYRCTCGHTFNLYNEYLELIDKHAKTIGVGCTKCGRVVSHQAVKECQSCVPHEV